ncbi:MAG: hypothetical protein AB2L14_22350 [Candidatus Xenobiia bacterium LiM19]
MESVSQEIIPEILLLKKKTVDEIKECEQTLKELRQMELFLGKLFSFMQGMKLQHILALTQKEKAAMESLRKKDSDSFTSLQKALSVIRSEAQTAMKRFPRLFQMACEETGLAIDESSIHPRYSFYDGFFTVEINESKGAAVIRDRMAKLHELPCDISEIIALIKEEHKRVFQRPFDPGRFLKKLFKYYSDQIKKEKKSIGDSVPIAGIINAFKAKDKSFKADEFLYDLSRLAEGGSQQIDGHLLDFQHTKDTESGILLYKHESGGYIGYILFRRSTNA